MLKTASLGRYWQDNSAGSSFTRVRCISTGTQAISHLYGSFLKTRANSVPESTSSIKNFRKMKKFSLQNPVMEGNAATEEMNQSFCSSRSNTNSEHSLNRLEIALHEEGVEEVSGEERTLLVCTLDTEQNERNRDHGQADRESSEERTHSLSGSVDMVTAMLTNSTTTTTNSTVPPASPATTERQACRSCGNCLEYSDMVVIFDSDAYHLQCFNCSQCSQPVDPAHEFLVLEDGSPLCQGCSPECHACGKKIVSCHVNVLNKDFHEECLKCFVCKKVRMKLLLLQLFFFCSNNAVTNTLTKYSTLPIYSRICKVKGKLQSV